MKTYGSEIRFRDTDAPLILDRVTDHFVGVSSVTLFSNTDEKMIIPLDRVEWIAIYPEDTV